MSLFDQIATINQKYHLIADMLVNRAEAALTMGFDKLSNELFDQSIKIRDLADEMKNVVSKDLDKRYKQTAAATGQILGKLIDQVNEE
jgi:hypothetical protein